MNKYLSNTSLIYTCKIIKFYKMLEKQLMFKINFSFVFIIFRIVFKIRMQIQNINLNDFYNLNKSN